MAREPEWAIELTPEPTLEKLLGLERSPSITDVNFWGKKVKTLDAGGKKNVTQLHVEVNFVLGDREERHEIK